MGFSNCCAQRDKFQHRWKGHIIFAELHCDGAGELHVSSAKLEEALKSQVKGPKPRLDLMGDGRTVVRRGLATVDRRKESRPAGARLLLIQ
jgi:hypothetical protein